LFTCSYFIFAGNTGQALKLIDKGADIHFVDPRDGWAGAHYAARFGKIKILETMINAGLDVNMRTTGKETLLHKACRTNRTSTVLWLMKVGFFVRNMIFLLLSLDIFSSSSSYPDQQRGANPQLLNGTGEKASQLTTDPECIFMCEHWEEYLQMAKDGRPMDISYFFLFSAYLHNLRTYSLSSHIHTSSINKHTINRHTTTIFMYSTAIIP